MSAPGSKMECEICKRSPSSKLPFYCTFCARGSLYQPRLQHAQILLQKESLEKQIEETVNSTSIPSKSSATDTKKKDGRSAWILGCAQRDASVSEGKIRQIMPHIEVLRDEIQRMKEDVSARQARIKQRRSELVAAKQELRRSQASAVGPLEKGIRRTKQQWDLLHSSTAESRLFLCKEAALLYGLSKQERRKEVKGRDIYKIGGTPILDLRDLNNTTPAAINTSNSQVAHFVHLLSHYLSLKLPAEITLPHRDYPFPTIFSPTSSYTTNRPVPFPGTTPSQSSSNSPSASRHHHSQTNDQLRQLPRPRLLHLDKPLSILAKEDQITYSSFVEGITFLAWDIAWLCRTQGLSTGVNTWEDICDMGKNLYQLVFIGPPKSLNPGNGRNTTASDVTTANPTPNSSKRPPQTSPPPPPPPAHFSHNTTYAFLATAAGTEYMTHGCRLNSPVKATERVKAMLFAERTGAEWEMLEDEEWALAPAAEEEHLSTQQQQRPAVATATNAAPPPPRTTTPTSTLRSRKPPDRHPSSNGAAPRSKLAPSSAAAAAAVPRPRVDETGILVPGAAEAETEKQQEADKEQQRPANGWMKVKSRSHAPAVPAAAPAAAAAPPGLVERKKSTTSAAPPAFVG